MHVGFKILCLLPGLILTLGLGGCNQASSINRELSQVRASNDSSHETPSESQPSNNSSITEPIIRIGVLTIDSAVSVHKRYQPLVDYLSQRLERPFELIPLTFKGQFTAVEQGEVDFIANNPLAAVQVQRLYNTEFLVTHSRPRTGNQFSGLIIVKSDSKIQTIADLKGKQVACVDFEAAAAGCLFQVYHVRQKNLDPFEDFGTFVENPSQDNIVFGVLNGMLDAGFIRTGQLEKMLKNNLLTTLDDIRILEPVDDQFFFQHTTALYPEWPIAALSSTSQELRDAVQAALLDLPEGHEALSAANIEQFTEVVDYQPIHDLIETLQLESWDTDS